MDRIGIIVPVYKAEKYLDRCVGSILRQTYGEFTLLLVNDGSPDNSGALCDAYAARDSRIHVTHLDHVGVSAVRNEGVRWMLEESECQWLLFIDSDDWVHPEMLERLWNAAQQYHVDVSLCGYGETVDETSPWGEEIAEATLWTPEEFYLHYFINATIPVAKLCRRSCFVNRKYPVGKIHEDEFVTYQILFAQKQVAAILSPMYAYYYNPESITKKPWTPDRLDTWGAYEEQIAFFTERGNMDIVRFRYQGYLENAMVNLAEAEKYPDKVVAGPVIRKIHKKIRDVIRRAWKVGAIDFRMDYELLERFYPVITKTYRLIWEMKQK